MTLSPTRKKLDSRRERLFVLLGILELFCAAVWHREADISLAEGKKAAGIMSIFVAALYMVAAVGHIRGEKH